MRGMSELFWRRIAARVTLHALPALEPRPLDILDSLVKATMFNQGLLA
jgi:hypothetical protein